MVAITDGQAELRADTGDALVIGDGTDFGWAESGPTWWSAPEVRTSDLARSGANGYIPGRDLLGKHATTIVVNILGDSESDLGDLIDTWKAACAISSDELVTVRANLLGRTRRRVGRFRIPGEANTALARSGYYALGSAQFEALDASTYGDDLHSVVTARAQPGAGVALPFVLPITLPASTSSGAVNVENDGTGPAPWTARLDGPLTNPQITHAGQRLNFAANGGLDIASGQWVDIDSARRSVLLNGTADRRDLLTIDSEWWSLDPGANTFQLDADAGAGTLTVSWRDTWHS